MVACCRCSGAGICRNCACVKAGKTCTTCLPGRRGHCLNMKQSSAPESAPVQPPTPNTQPPATSDSVVSPSRTNLSQQTTQPPPPSPPPADITPQATPPRSGLTPSSAHLLPPPQLLASSTFKWGEHDSSSYSTSLSLAYQKVVHWRSNIFRVPQGKGGKLFVSELARLVRAYAEGSALEQIAWSAIIVLSALALQKPSRKAKSKELNACLERRMAVWARGDISDLLEEGRCLQQRLPKGVLSQKGDQKLARAFSNLMFQGKTGAALDLLSHKGKSGVLHVNDLVTRDDPTSPSVLDVLKTKHPAAHPASADALISDRQDPPITHQVIFDQIDASSIRSASLSTTGAAGPSGLNAHCWRRLCTSFHAASRDLCYSLALFARRLSTTLVDPKGLSSFLGCRLIALDKCPGVRPIGVCETVRRIVAKAILYVTKLDIQEAAGTRQLGGGQIAGIEAAVHSVQREFQSEDVEAVLLVDASNAFNSLNREAALHNIQYICPPLATALINTYRTPTELFVNGITLLSEEGTTQGDPFAMPFYALATVPLIRRLDNAEELKQVWYADDASASGSLVSIRSWWDQLSTAGPAFGYHANAAKTWLVTKGKYLERAREVFHDTNVNVTCHGRPYLGAPLGTCEYTKQYAQEKVYCWVGDLKLLADIAKTQPHAAYSAYTHGFSHKFSYLCRTTPDIASQLEPLEDFLRTTFIPALTGRAPPDDVTRDLLALPARLGGLSIANPTKSCQYDYSGSTTIAGPLTALISDQCDEYAYECIAAQLAAKTETRTNKRNLEKEAALAVRDLLPDSMQRAIDLAQEKGASSWLMSRPIEEFGFSLHKGAFRDAIALRYGWTPLNIPTHCACGTSFSVQHALSCPKGGFPTLRHNELRDLTAELMTEVSHNVCIEPHLQPLTGEVLNGATAIVTDGARLDVAADGFWGGRHERAFFDIRVFNPFAQSNSQSIPSCYRKHENIKKRAYEQRIREIEHGSFTPLVLSLTGGMGPTASMCFKRLASKLAQKKDQTYSSTMAWIRCSLSFALLKSSIQCIRGARSAVGRAARDHLPPADLVSSEAGYMDYA